MVVLAPQGLDLSAYRELLPGAGELRVAPHWMESHAAYNRLMIAPLVYEALADYSHVLVHEPDALVLRDELDHWCAQPFDYIGAPWFEGFADPGPDTPLVAVGNFGLSLLRVDAARAALSSRKRWHPVVTAGKDLVKGLLGSRERLRRGWHGIGAGGQLRGAWRLYDSHCDIFWCELVPSLLPSFRVASVAEALRFSWEVLPGRCFELCDGRLPFGFHAWARYDLEFLIPHLRASGVDLSPLDAVRA
jgi:hypothetical protein